MISLQPVHSRIQSPYGNCTVHSGSRRCIKPPYISEGPLVGAGVNVFLFSGPWEGSLQTSQCLTQRCLVRPNMPQADHCLPAYKLKYIASAVRYYLFCCRVLFQTSHWEVLLISQRLMSGAATSLACVKPRMSNDHHHEFMKSAANEWLIRCLFFGGFFCCHVLTSVPRQHVCSTISTLCLCALL